MVAHGFLALAPTRLLYLVTNEYDDTDELGLAWDDPELAVAWPTVATPDARPILSDRDRGNPSFAEIRGRIASRWQRGDDEDPRQDEVTGSALPR